MALKVEECGKVIHFVLSGQPVASEGINAMKHDLFGREVELFGCIIVLGQVLLTTIGHNYYHVSRHM